MLANLAVALLSVIAFGAWAIYTIWYIGADDDGYWRHGKKARAEKAPEHEEDSQKTA
ncbi:MAG: hypothetical protein PUC99_11490 [Eubacteriales bacterium]|jgi:hypothetical protein|nr:hypothetical protein [Lachnospiraceae bacterium]MDD5860934.1 hypothetical protein [Eubacteriales bacterium]MCH4063825.1 hypothetical protein [Lachnospiraceae bacterium]MCH4103453.1 hypothetical protein [Lachnospiraceae bacterium]MCI1310109.1 hypothetical protein [Lachnospiraceae bacterium]